jgi:acetyltransferase-like isoleucine patch superfamily enzyme
MDQQRQTVLVPSALDHHHEVDTERAAIPPQVKPRETLGPVPEPTGFAKLRSHFGGAFYNLIFTGVPFHAVRQGFLRASGMKIGKKVSLLRGTTIIRPDRIRIGDHCIVGFQCFLGGEGGIDIGNNVNISSFSVLLGGYHDINSPKFDSVCKPMVIEDYAWIATRATIMSGLRIGRGAVVAAGAVVTRNVPDYDIVAGVPARKIGERNPEACAYEFSYQPWLF